jgi:hypothetical protein
MQDDRINPLTGIVSASVILVLLAAFVTLYIFPTHTDIDFAWTINPPTTAILIGAGYTAGAYFFARLLIDKKWHRVQAGFLPITLFTIIMLVDTLLHWNRFHQGTFIFYVWTVVYILTPVIVPFLWWRNRATEMRALEQQDLRYPGFVRWGIGALALAGILVCLVITARPAILIPIAPWKLTELTARILAGWGMLTCASALSIVHDGRWSAARTLVQSAKVGLSLTAIALPRMWADFDLANPLAYVFAGGTLLTLLALFILHFWLDRAARSR